MTKIFTSLFLILNTALVIGQVTITADKYTVSKSGLANDFSIIGKILLTNTSSEDKVFTWVRDSTGLVAGWESSICDKNQCYSRKDSTKIYAIEAGETAKIEFNLHPESYCGEGFGKLTFTDNADPNNFIVLQFDFLANQDPNVECSVISISANERQVFNSGLASNFDILGSAILTNESDEDKTFTWVRNSSGLLDGWESGVIDNSQSYFNTQSTGSFNLAAGAQGNIDLRVYPEGFCGEGFAEITVTDDSDPKNFVYIRYNFEALEDPDVACVSSNGVFDFELDYVNLYPNPAMDFFTLTDVPAGLEQITIYSILGKKVKTFNAAVNATYNISNLTKGLYLVKLTNTKGENLNTVKLYKN